MASTDERGPRTVTELIHTFASFLVVSIHTILYHRRLYPRSTFLTTRAYNYPVAQSRHPSVCQWISDAVDAVSAQLLRPKDDVLAPTGKGDVGGWVERVVLVVFSDDAEVMERYVWDVSSLPTVPAREVETPFAQVSAAGEEDGAKAHFVDPSKVHMDLSTQFRAMLSQMDGLSKRLAPLPPGCTFSLAIELADDADPPVGHPQEQDWIAAEPALQRRAGTNLMMEGAFEGGWSTDNSHSMSAQQGKDLVGAKTLAMRKIDAGSMVIEMWVEEGKSKQQTLERTKKSFTSSTST